MDPHTTYNTLNLPTRGTQVAQCCTSCSARRACGGGHGRQWSTGPKSIPACRRSTLLERSHVQGLVEGRRRRSHCSTRVVDASDETISKSAASTETRDVASTASTAPSIVTGRRPSTAVYLQTRSLPSTSVYSVDSRHFSAQVPCFASSVVALACTRATAARRLVPRHGCTLPAAQRRDSATARHKRHRASSGRCL